MSSAQELEVDELVEAVLDTQRHDRGARGGADDRGARPDREPPGARRRRAGVQGRAGGAVARGVPAVDLARLRPGRDRRRGVARDADDAPQREGARVPRRLHDRHGGRDLPALPLDRGAGDRGGAAARLRRHDPRDGAADADARHRRGRSTAGAIQPAVALPRRAAAASSASGCARRRGRATAPSGRPASLGAAREPSEIPVARRRATPSATARSARASSRASSRAGSSPSASQRRQRAEADARVRAAGEDPDGDPRPLDAKPGGVRGRPRRHRPLPRRGWTPEEAEQCAQLLPPERLHAASTATRSSAAPASSRSSSRPGRRAPAAPASRWSACCRRTAAAGSSAG